MGERNNVTGGYWEAGSKVCQGSVQLAVEMRYVGWIVADVVKIVVLRIVAAIREPYHYQNIYSRDKKFFKLRGA